MRKLLVCLLFAVAPLTAAAAQHSVALSGCTSTTPGVQFNLYRGTTPGGESLTPLNSAPLATCAYTDTNVVGLGTYYYVAKAFCSTCSPNLSGPGNEVKAVIPGDAQPNPPTGLSLGTVAGVRVPLFWNAPAPQSDFTVASYYVNKGSTPSNPSRIAVVPASQRSYTDRRCKGSCYYNVQALDDSSAGRVTSRASNLVLVVN